ncbi:MAG: 3-deoxy-manno-octulosonate cytidylyltransferase [Desulfobacterales bacterium]|nr:3-deoxy-manno-octulosonate cytidylyltransferase [Desulfobacterales bacterium]MCP4161294.1 3-deoxy-manno-octulosonate cytidylyltransferase [Deltaproteobacteria bacterium]
MQKKTDCYGIIPARYASTRFPGKPLVDIKGKPMFWHVYNQSLKCSGITKVVLATDDERISSKASELNVPFVMTREDHPSGTDRVLEAAEKLDINEDAVVVNIQGDEPALNPEMLDELIAPFKDESVKVTTLATKINMEEAKNPDRVKVIFGKNSKALYFSRSMIPYPRDNEEISFHGHIGLYAFRMGTLKEFVRLGKSYLETTEKLEQLRLLENGIPIHVVVTEHKSIGVDRPDDLNIINELIEND